MNRCPMLRAYAEMPDLVCVYTAPQTPKDNDRG